MRIIFQMPRFSHVTTLIPPRCSLIGRLLAVAPTPSLTHSLLHSSSRCAQPTKLVSPRNLSQPSAARRERTPQRAHTTPATRETLTLPLHQRHLIPLNYLCPHIHDNNPSTQAAIYGNRFLRLCLPYPPRSYIIFRCLVLTEPQSRP